MSERTIRRARTETAEFRRDSMGNSRRRASCGQPMERANGYKTRRIYVEVPISCDRNWRLSPFEPARPARVDFGLLLCAAHRLCCSAHISSEPLLRPEMTMALAATRGDTTGDLIASARAATAAAEALLA